MIGAIDMQRFVTMAWPLFCDIGWATIGCPNRLARSDHCFWLPNLRPAASEAATGAIARATASAVGADADDASPDDDDVEDEEGSPLLAGFGGAKISAIASLMRARAIRIMRSGGTSANAHELRWGKCQTQTIKRARTVIR
jgi:hypothetical protein